MQFEDDAFFLPTYTAHGGYLMVEDGEFGANVIDELACEVLDYSGCRIASDYGDSHIHGFDNAGTMGCKVLVRTYNGMSGLHHRKSGIVGAALSVDGKPFSELICDSHHVNLTLASVVMSARCHEASMHAVKKCARVRLSLGCALRLDQVRSATCVNVDAPGSFRHDAVVHSHARVVFCSQASVSRTGACKNLYLVEGRSQNSYIKGGAKAGELARCLVGHPTVCVRWRPLQEPPLLRSCGTRSNPRDSMRC